MRGLRRQNVGDIRALDVLVVQRTGVEDRIFSRGFGTVDVDGEFRAVAHRHLDIALLNELDRIGHRFLPVSSPNAPRAGARFANFYDRPV